MLSGIDFRRKLGKNISIYPFNEQNIESANICVTASEFAWSIGEEKEYLFTKESGMGKYNKGRIRIPAKQSALVFTQEALYLGEKLAGSCLARVDLSLKGLGYNGGPLKSERAELLKIPMYNQTEHDVYIDVGERIAVLMIHELSSKDKSKQSEDDDHNTKIDEFLSKCKSSENVIRLLNMSRGLNSKDDITKKMENDPNYKKYNNSENTLFKRIMRNKTMFVCTLLLVVLLLIICLFIKDRQPYLTVFAALIGGDLGMIGGLLLKKFKLE